VKKEQLRGKKRKIVRPHLIIGITGPSGSGKTRLIKEIIKLLKERNEENLLQVIDGDNYYKPLEGKTFEERENTNFDEPRIMMYPLLVKHIRCLMRGKTVRHKKYDFKQYTWGNQTIAYEPKPVLIVAGHLVFCNKMLRHLFDIEVYMDVPADIRLLRRLKRDRERGRPVELVLKQWVRAREGYERYIKQFEDQADIKFTSAINPVSLDLLVTKIVSVVRA
jgi:uridine kinase